MKTLPVAQLTSFLREARESGVFEVYYLELAAGLRRGELLSLQWEDIDLERGNLRVRRQSFHRNSTLTKTFLKIRSAYRTLFSVQSVAGVLDQHLGMGGERTGTYLTCFVLNLGLQNGQI